ncbi:hypothetical protein [Nocardiopsis sp. NPDC006938]|uniref:hypothetical protein n=1 Tax=Nocardiopsis sp. NPDC006938 TaxID=3364337 RepID=UPI0036BD442D
MRSFLGPLICTVALTLAVSACSPGGTVDLDNVFAQPEGEWHLQSNPQEATSELCTETLDCIQSYTTDQADYLRFASTDDAEAAAAGMASPTHLSNYIVIRFTDPELTDEQRTQMAERIDGVHNSDT